MVVSLGETGRWKVLPRNMHVSRAEVCGQLSVQMQQFWGGSVAPGLPCSGIPPSTPGKKSWEQQPESEEPLEEEALPWGAPPTFPSEDV